MGGNEDLDTGRRAGDTGHDSRDRNHQIGHVEEEDWLTDARLVERPSAEGWTVNRMKQDGGCWEVFGNMLDGKRVEYNLHPATGEVQLINQRGTVLFRKGE